MPDRVVRILYVDDDAAFVRLVEKACQRRGYHVTHASTVDEGLALLAEEEFSLVVLDHDLRTQTGLDFLNAVKDHAVRPPMIYVTGSAETSVAVSALKAGASDYVWKSSSGDFLDLLFSGIEPALERGRLERAKLRAEQEMREARERAELMLSEVNHRISNSLALVASLVRMQARVVKDPGAAEALVETQARIEAVAGVHRRLYKSTDVANVALDDYIRELIDDLQAGFRAEGRTSNIELSVVPAAAKPDQAVSIGVTVTELVTNAIKYAYPDGVPGPIRVSLRTVEPGRVEIAVEDDGAGWDGTGTVQGTGLGTRIVRAMMANLQSELVYDRMPAGTRSRFQFSV